MTVRRCAALLPHDTSDKSTIKQTTHQHTMAATKTAKKESAPAAPAKPKTPVVAKAAATPKVKALIVHAEAAGTVFTAAQLGALGDPKLAGIRLHGKEFVGTVISDKADKTVTVEWERRRLVKKFERYEKRYSRVYAHNPAQLGARLGDTVRIKESRPLSKTKNFVVVEVVTRAEVTK